MAAAKIKKGDSVVVLSGKDKGKTGTVAKVMPKDGKVVVEGVNVAARHRKRLHQRIAIVLQGRRGNVPPFDLVAADISQLPHRAVSVAGGECSVVGAATKGLSSTGVNGIHLRGWLMQARSAPSPRHPEEPRSGVSKDARPRAGAVDPSRRATRASG